MGFFYATLDIERVRTNTPLRGPSLSKPRSDSCESTDWASPKVLRTCAPHKLPGNTDRQQGGRRPGSQAPMTGAHSCTLSKQGLTPNCLRYNAQAALALAPRTVENQCCARILPEGCSRRGAPQGYVAGHATHAACTCCACRLYTLTHVCTRCVHLGTKRISANPNAFPRVVLFIFLTQDAVC